MKILKQSSEVFRVEPPTPVTEIVFIGWSLAPSNAVSISVRQIETNVLLLPHPPHPPKATKGLQQALTPLTSFLGMSSQHSLLLTEGGWQTVMLSSSQETQKAKPSACGHQARGFSSLRV